jgi:hypothetical protein
MNCSYLDNMTFFPHTPYSPDLTPCNFSVSSIEDKTERMPFWHNWGDTGRITGCAEHPQRMISRMHLKDWGSRRGLLPWWRWPVGSKLVFDQMAAPIPEIMDWYCMPNLNTVFNFGTQWHVTHIHQEVLHYVIHSASSLLHKNIFFSSLSKHLKHNFSQPHKT